MKADSFYKMTRENENKSEQTQEDYPSDLELEKDPLNSRREEMGLMGKSVWIILHSVCFIALVYFSWNVTMQYLEQTPMTSISYEDPPKKPDPVVVMICNNVLMDYRKILNYKSDKFSYDSYEFLHQAASGNISFNDSLWVLPSLSKNLFLISNRIKQEFKLDLEDFMIGCLVTKTSHDCMHQFKWQPSLYMSCYKATLNLEGYGIYNVLGVSFYFDPLLILGKYTSKLGAYISIFHPDDYIDPMEGFFLAPQTSVEVKATSVQRVQKKSFEKSKCVKGKLLDEFNFTGVPFEAIYNEKSCYDLCIAQEFHHLCNCSGYFGWNLTNTECIESADMKKCLKDAVAAYSNLDEGFKPCTDKCLRKCDQKSLQLKIFKEEFKMTGDRIRLILGTAAFLNFTHPVIKKMGKVFENQSDKVAAADEVSKHYAQMTFYMERSQEKVIETMAKTTFETFISNIGGLMGMCLGLSAVSLAELLQKIFQKGSKIATNKLSKHSINKQIT